MSVSLEESTALISIALMRTMLIGYLVGFFIGGKLVSFRQVLL